MMTLQRWTAMSWIVWCRTPSLSMSQTTASRTIGAWIDQDDWDNGLLHIGIKEARSGNPQESKAFGRGWGMSRHWMPFQLWHGSDKVHQSSGSKSKLQNNLLQLIGQHRGFCNDRYSGSCRLVLHIVLYVVLFYCVAVHELLELIIHSLNSHVNWCAKAVDEQGVLKRPVGCSTNATEHRHASRTKTKHL